MPWCTCFTASTNKYICLHQTCCLLDACWSRCRENVRHRAKSRQEKTPTFNQKHLSLQQLHKGDEMWSVPQRTQCHCAQCGMKTCSLNNSDISSSASLVYTTHHCSVEDGVFKVWMKRLTTALTLLCVFATFALVPTLSSCTYLLSLWWAWTDTSSPTASRVTRFHKPCLKLSKFTKMSRSVWTNEKTPKTVKWVLFVK